MVRLLRSFIRFARTLGGSITLGILGFLIVVGIGMGKVAAQSARSGQIAPSAVAQIQALVEEKESRTPTQQKISSSILYTIKAKRRDRLFSRVPKLNTFVKVTSDSKVRVNVKTNVPVTPELLQKIQAIGGEVLSSFPNYNTIQVLIALSQVESLAEFPEVRTIKPHIKPVTRAGSVTSEGDIAQGAATARTTFGVDGTGVKIGVLSDSYNNRRGAAPDIAKGDLPPNGVTLAGSGDIKRRSPDFPGTDEGRAMLQIVHDLAPGAELYFATAFNSEADFANNIRALQAAGCDIIVDDVAYLNEPVFQDGIIAQAVNEVTASGALYFSAAGNEGNKNDGTSGVWEGNFVDGGAAPAAIAGKVHAFSSDLSNTYNRLTTNSGQITLHWSDPVGQSANDYDLYVLDSSGTSVIGSSTDRQNGNDDPFEIVEPQATGNRVIVVKHRGQPRFLHLNTNRGQLELNTNGQIFGHAAAVNAFSVAAVNAEKRTKPFSRSLSVEDFSSDGPRRIFYQADGTPITPGNVLDGGGVVRQKPDIAAADGVVTTLPASTGLNPFFGTSAAAPHAAAVAALLKSFKPALTPQRIRSILTRTALDIEASGVDQDSGYGIVMANRALQRAAQLP
jgi:hypothetical protein